MRERIQTMGGSVVGLMMSLLMGGVLVGLQLAG